MKKKVKQSNHRNLCPIFQKLKAEGENQVKNYPPKKRKIEQYS